MANYIGRERFYYLTGAESDANTLHFCCTILMFYIGGIVMHWLFHIHIQRERERERERERDMLIY